MQICMVSKQYILWNCFKTGILFHNRIDFLDKNMVTFSYKCGNSTTLLMRTSKIPMKSFKYYKTYSQINGIYFLLQKCKQNFWSRHKSSTSCNTILVFFFRKKLWKLNSDYFWQHSSLNDTHNFLKVDYIAINSPVSTRSD